MGISETLRGWIKGYLFNRQMCTKLNGFTSTSKKLCSTGVRDAQALLLSGRHAGLYAAHVYIHKGGQALSFIVDVT